MSSKREEVTVCDRRAVCSTEDKRMYVSKDTKKQKIEKERV